MNIPFDLKESVQNNTLVLFVGSGFSTNAGLPTWADLVKIFLTDNRDRIPNANVYEQNLEVGILSPIEVLEKLKDKYKKQIYESFEKKLSNGVQSEIHKKLCKISNKIITTNYDKLIEYNSESATVIDTSSAYNLSKIDIQSEFILKIHGDISRLDSCIVFNDDYIRLYSGNTLGKFQLEKIFSSCSCLFIGFSFNDPYVEKLFEKISTLYSGFGRPHFWATTAEREFDGISKIKLSKNDEVEELIDNLLNIKQAPMPLQQLPEETSKQLEDKSSELELKNEGTDIPPNIDYWVGRDSELRSLGIDDSFKVFFITGIGGEGKSSLAAYYSEQSKKSEKYEIIDWRDFKEQEHNFDLKIINIIERITYNNITHENLVGLETDTLINIFFRELKDKSCLFVFDNVDSYIDLEKFEPIGNIGKLVELALKNHHNSKFIFTCRPFIHYAGVDFLQLRLSGLTKEDVLQLFSSSKLPIGSTHIEQIAERAHKFTDGHALWISLILAQAKRGLREVDDFLLKIEKKHITAPSESSFLSERILREIWDSLNSKQKILLRTLAEAVTSETEEEISKIIGSELNYNQFSKSLRTLKDLHLIVVKGEESYLELHPLVKEFIKTNFPSHEQKKYISLFISYYDRVIVLLKPRLNQILSLGEFKSWSNKIELQINNKEYNDAIALLLEIHDAIIRSGYIEEFVRLSCLLLDGLQWSKRNTSQIKNLPKFINEAITSIIDYGDNSSATKHLESYKTSIAGKNNEYILSLSLYTHLHWYNGNFADAIKCGEEAQHLISRSGDSDIWSAKHRLNLAYRDSKIAKNINLALNFFLSSYELEEIISPNSFNSEVPYTLYGNTGRCLHFMERYEDALNCYAKSALLISKDNTADEELNKGYAFSWIGETLKISGSEDYLYFLLYAHQSWKTVAPPLANKIEEIINTLPKTPTMKSIRSTSSWDIERYCTDWYQKRVKDN